MREWIINNFVHVLAVLILISRIGDIGSTWIVSPTLKLESNLLVRKLGWPFAFFSLLLCLVPYLDPAASLIVLVASLLVTSSNLSKAWFVRAMGEEEYSYLMFQMARRANFGFVVLSIWGSAFFVLLAGAVLVFLAPDPNNDWAFWFGMGIITYGAAMLIHGSLAYFKLFRKIRQLDRIEKQGPFSAFDDQVE
ncbi:MAG: hypothetical protein ACLFUS_02705 [Candidatus Sumerlaeia bacterium]